MRRIWRPVSRPRARDERAITRWITSQSQDLLLLTGAGGIGKTFTVSRSMQQLGDQVVAYRFGGIGAAGPAYLHPVPGTSDLAGALIDQPVDIEDPDDLAGPAFEDQLRELTRAVRAVSSNSVARVLFIDDIGSVDKAMVGVLTGLRRTAQKLGWRVILAARSAPLALYLPDGFLVRRLEPLNVNDLRDVVQEAFAASVSLVVARRLHWWSGGSPLLALEIVDDLSDAELSGDRPWPGPARVGEGAMRLYGALVESLSASARALLVTLNASPYVSRKAGRSWDRCVWKELEEAGLVASAGEGWELLAPMAALLAEADPLPTGELQWHGPIAVDGRSSSRSGAERGIAEDHRAHRRIANSLIRGLMSGDASAMEPGSCGAEPTERHECPDHVWFDDPEAVSEELLKAGRRMLASVLRLERADSAIAWSQLLDDARRIAATSSLSVRGVFPLVKVLLTTGELSLARSLLSAKHEALRLDSSQSQIQRVGGDPDGTLGWVSVAFAAAHLALVDGHYHRAECWLDEMTRLNPMLDGAPTVESMRAVTRAMLAGARPDNSAPEQIHGLSSRATGERAINLGQAYAALSDHTTAVALFAVGLDFAPTPYQGSLDIASLGVAMVGAAPDPSSRRFSTIFSRVLDAAQEHEGIPTRAATSVRLRAEAVQATAGFVRGRDDPAHIRALYVESLTAAAAEGSVKQRIITQLCFAHFLVKSGEKFDAEVMRERAAATATLAGLDGWRRAIGSEAPPETPEPVEVTIDWQEFDELERDILVLAGRGATNVEIANAVYVSERTVVNRLRRIYARCGVNGRAGLRGLMDLAPPQWPDNA
ncbi:helix-turn-helix domain-containing protein [Aeromicrobium sp. YIM 150415]|uniref:helix-turn-helix transcriptional regulator n=1 Tax=Aeromicrobium sp. YIM 150415 TaxID=2803912 RepID=UPI001964B860|nr:helix-turn-helix transcriptional regulator [Aeromicrobium sp. YIM 150415]MBM9463646.1 helix-turn-helix domain-containing protein [Aeromicrobium sp. YIM 150415]